MTQKNLMPIREFSKLTGIKRENLRFYDQIGLLCPEVRGENDYRYYSRRQLNSAYLISELRALGVGLKEIKQYSMERTPEKMLELFAQQELRIKTEISRLKEIRKVMNLQAAMARDALSYEHDAILLEEKKAEPIFLCPPLLEDTDLDEGGYLAYAYAEKHNINPGYPLGTVISFERFAKGDSSIVSRYYLKAATGHNGSKPAGLYAIAYGRCNVWKSGAVYQRLLKFIKMRRLRPCGDAYEEYPLNEMAVQNADLHAIRIEIPVTPLN